MVFCSLDNDPDQYKEYYGSMPWLSLGYNNPAVTKLKQILGIEGIPTFVMCNTDLVPVTAEGVEAVKASGAEGFPWLPNAVKDLNLEPDDINAKPCLVFFMDKCGCSDEVKEQKIETLSAVADQIKDAVSIFYVRESGDVSTQIRGMLQNDACPLLAIVDIPDNGGYYIAESSELTPENVVSFVQGFVNKTIKRKQMVA